MSRFRPTLNNFVVATAMAVLMTGTTITMLNAQNETISACYNSRSGELKIAVQGSCHANENLLQWTQSGIPGPPGLPGPAGPPGPSGVANVYYISAGMYPGTSVSRAFCPPDTKVTGGGGFAVNERGLRYSYPIADETGLNAYDSIAIGWQVAADDWSDVQSFVVCAGP